MLSSLYLAFTLLYGLELATISGRIACTCPEDTVSLADLAFISVIHDNGADNGTALTVGFGDGVPSSSMTRRVSPTMRTRCTTVFGFPYTPAMDEYGLPHGADCGMMPLER